MRLQKLPEHRRVCQSTAALAFVLVYASCFAGSDLIWRYHGTQPSSGLGITFIANGTNGLASYPLANSKSLKGWHVCGCGDFNGDGKEDMLWQKDDETALSLAAWFYNGTNFIGSAFLNPSSPVSEGWRVIGVADMDHDQRPDILWHHNSGSVGIWYMAGVTRKSAKVISQSSTEGWIAVGLGDFNGDNTPDILWHLPKTKTTHALLGVWFLAGTDGSQKVGSSLTGLELGEVGWSPATVIDVDQNKRPAIVFTNSIPGRLACGKFEYETLPGVGVGVLSTITPVDLSLSAGTNFFLTEGWRLEASGHFGGIHSNSFGMRYVPVPEAGVWFSVWETRRRDYEAFAGANPKTDATWKTVVYGTSHVAGGPDHPVVCVNWNDAVEYCRWLTTVDRARGVISADQLYRLPSDQEWSIAAGLGREPGATPAERDRRSQLYAWGASWPPPPRAGNFADESATLLGIPFIHGYNDGYATTAPVGSFLPNRHGLFDMAGNVWEWCEDAFDGSGRDRTLRGGAWNGSHPGFLTVSCRSAFVPTIRLGIHGFRTVLANKMPGVAVQVTR